MALELKYIPLDEVKIYAGNQKLHDIGAICNSIRTRGFRIPVVFDATLDAVIDGNGRVEALNFLYDDWLQGEENVPGGIVVEDSMWLIPVIVGLDSATVEEAQAFLVDANNLVFMGGDFTALDAARAWDKGYLQLLQECIQYTQTVDRSDLALMLELINVDTQEEEMLEQREETKESPLSYCLQFINEEDLQEFKELIVSNSLEETPAQVVLRAIRNLL